MKIPKINSIHFGSQCIALAILIGLIIPAGIWFIFHVFLWGFCIAGGVILVGFIIIFSIEMKQDFGAIPYYQQHLKDSIPYDPEVQYPVIKSSICTGEKMAGFKNKIDGKFVEVMLITSDSDKEQFMKIYDLEKVETEY